MNVILLSVLFSLQPIAFPLGINPLTPPSRRIELYYIHPLTFSVLLSPLPNFVLSGSYWSLSGFGGTYSIGGILRQRLKVKGSILSCGLHRIQGAISLGPIWTSFNTWMFHIEAARKTGNNIGGAQLRLMATSEEAGILGLVLRGSQLKWGMSFFVQAELLREDLKKPLILMFEATPSAKGVLSFTTLSVPAFWERFRIDMSLKLQAEGDNFSLAPIIRASIIQ